MKWLKTCRVCALVTNITKEKLDNCLFVTCCWIKEPKHTMRKKNRSRDITKKLHCVYHQPCGVRDQSSHYVASHLYAWFPCCGSSPGPTHKNKGTCYLMVRYFFPQEFQNTNRLNDAAYKTSYRPLMAYTEACCCTKLEQKNHKVKKKKLVQRQSRV